VNSLDSRINQLLCEIISRDVSTDDDRLSSHLLDLIGDELSLLRVEIGDDNFRSFLCEEESRLSSDTLRSLNFATDVRAESAMDVAHQDEVQ
jgi:hypothetical protein